MDTLIWLQNWYLKWCDGDWEHSYGVKIDTLDNPGWSVEIDLTDTDFEKKDFEIIRLERSQHDWTHCSVQEGVYKGRGGPENLRELIEIFRQWVASHE